MTGARILGTFHYGYTVAPGGKICYTALYNGYPTQGKGGADMKKRIALCLIALLLLLPAAGCGEKKNTDPLTVTLWHVYGGEVDSPLNGLIERFNSTIGVEKNIRVKVELVSNSGSIHKSVLAAANSDPGAPTLPDMFVSYPKTVLALPDEDILVDYRDYLSGEELGAFLPAFLEEGQVNGRQVILPIAKSTEVLFVNRTLFDRWAAASGASYDDLATWEGIYALAEKYAADTGKCFLVNDYHFNYFQVGVTSLGEDFFQNDGVRFGSGFERAWEPYAHAALEGGVWLQDGYATESLRTGDTIASVASSASVLYYSDTVTYPDNTSEKVSITSLPYPVFEGGEKLVMQRGVGMCTTKSTPEREKACITFLKWLTEPERNVEFVTSLGYMPVTQEAFDKYLPDAVESLTDPMYISLYETYLQTQEEYTFYYPPQMENYLDLETRFENLSRLKMIAGRAQYLEGSGTAEELVWDTLDSFKLDYGT